MLIVRPFSIHFVAVLDPWIGRAQRISIDLHDYPGMGPSILAKAATPARLPGEPGVHFHSSYCPVILDNFRMADPSSTFSSGLIDTNGCRKVDPKPTP